MQPHAVEASKVIEQLQRIIAGQALELAKAEVIVANLEETIALQGHVLQQYEDEQREGQLLERYDSEEVT